MHMIWHDHKGQRVNPIILVGFSKLLHNQAPEPPIVEDWFTPVHHGGQQVNVPCL
ncbi:hypothetical protein SAMN03159318_00088 [Pseudomonas sp. NFACC42-2]|nr:hypothetical protein SAMN03159318_00088 [Pseudomonas sp. NFACC42-2]